MDIYYLLVLIWLAVGLAMVAGSFALYPDLYAGAGRKIWEGAYALASVLLIVGWLLLAGPFGVIVTSLCMSAADDDGIR